VGGSTRTGKRDDGGIGGGVRGGGEEALMLETPRLELSGVENVSPEGREGGREGRKE